MNSIAKVLIAAFVLTCEAAVTAPNIAGIWSSTSRTKGGLGSQWSFAGDGRVAYTFGAIVDFRYSATGGKLAMTFVQPGETAGDKSTSDYSVTQDTLTINPADAERRQVMHRVDASREPNSLVGEWTYSHYTGGPAFMRFSTNGGGQLLVPMKTIQGSYRVEGERLTITLPGENALLTGILSGESLSIRDARGQETSLTRFRY